MLACVLLFAVWGRKDGRCDISGQGQQHFATFST